jgi:hypothetical protein
MSLEEIKVILETPVALFVLMIFGSIVSMAKQIKDARNNGATLPVSDYLLSIDTFIGLGANVIAFIGLIMTDTLNWTGALAIGYALNSAADIRSGGRSAAIIDSIPDTK